MPSFLEQLLENFKDGSASKEKVLGEIEAFYGYSDIGIAKIDDYREERTGLAEFVFGGSKSVEMLKRILSHYVKLERNCLITKLNNEKALALKVFFPKLHYSQKAKLAWIRFRARPLQTDVPIGVVTAGTSDLPIALESLLTLRFLGHRPKLVADVGVSAIQRLLSKKELIQKFKIIICVAGMEAALLPALAGLTGKPIVGVPTSTGYGASFDGLSALLSMLNSCSPNVSSVNIDNGFGAACFCHSLISSMTNKDD